MNTDLFLKDMDGDFQNKRHDNPQLKSRSDVHKLTDQTRK